MRSIFTPSFLVNLSQTNKQKATKSCTTVLSCNSSAGETGSEELRVRRPARGRLVLHHAHNQTNRKLKTKDFVLKARAVHFAKELTL